MTTKIHATVDARGFPTGFHLTPVQAHDPEDADMLLKVTKGAMAIADKACDAHVRVIELLLYPSKAAVIPPKSLAQTSAQL